MARKEGASSYIHESAPPIDQRSITAVPLKWPVDKGLLIEYFVVILYYLLKSQGTLG